ncbi:MAG: BatD family protein [Bacteroidales bacterium]|nr:BatD family protein [Bacteroidales bacterium]
MKRFIAILPILLWIGILPISGGVKGGLDDITLTVQAPTTVEAGDQFRIRFTVNSQNVSNFSAPDFKGFEVIYGPSTSRQSSFQIVNGQTTQSSSITYTYVLIGSKPGTYTINPAAIQSGSSIIKSKSLTIKVLKPGTGGTNIGQQQSSSSSAPSHPNQQPATPSRNGISSSDLFMTATASRTNVYEQEAILVTYKLYTLVNITALDGKLPTLDGFQIQEIDLPRNKEFGLETYNGRNYHSVVWSQYVLFPQKTGKLTIPSVTFEGTVVQPNRNIDPIDVFFNGASGMVELKKKITTPTLTINVQPLPAKPAGFTGAVGTFNISSTLSPQEVKTNDAVTMTITINGTGNMKLIGTPEVAFPKDFETYDAKVTDNFSKSSSGLTGTKTFEYLAVPRHAGTYTIPATTFTYFDTHTHAYKTVQTQAYTLNVVKGQGDASSEIADFSSNQQDVRTLGNDIRYIKTHDITPSKDDDQNRLTSWRYLISYLIPLLLFLIIVFFGRKQIQDNANLAVIRGKKANKVARRRLKRAAHLMQEHKQNDFYDEVLKALYGYTSDKLNIPQEHLNKDNVQQELLDKGVTPDIIDQYLGVLNDCEFARYAPGDPNANMEGIYNKAITLISKIEDNIKK